MTSLINEDSFKIGKYKKARDNGGNQIAIGYLLTSDWLGALRFLDQSQTVVKQNQSNPRLLSTFN